MTDDELRLLAKLLYPYRDKVEDIWGRRRPSTRSAGASVSAGPTELLTILQAAAVLGVKSGTPVYRLISEGELAAVDIGGRGSQRAKTRVRRDDLQAFIDKRTRVAPARRS